jgi:hypothetical protein
LYRQRVRTASCQSVRRQSVRRPHAQVALTRRRKAALLSLVVIVAGCATVVPFEMLNTRDRGCGDLISLMEYAWSAAVSSPQLRRKQHIPWQAHGLLMLCGVTYSTMCNKALALALPMPVFLAMKNGTLVANMMVGRLALGRRYSLQQMLAVLCVSVGLVVTTFACRHAPPPPTQSYAPPCKLRHI